MSIDLHNAPRTLKQWSTMVSTYPVVHCFYTTLVKVLSCLCLYRQLTRSALLIRFTPQEPLLPHSSPISLPETSPLLDPPSTFNPNIKHHSSIRPEPMPSLPMLLSRTPKASIAGLQLTRDQTQHLFNDITLLTHHMSDQIAEILQLNNTRISGCTEDFRKVLTSVQTRQGTIHTLLDSLVKMTSSSTEVDLWVHEVYDCQQAVLRKVMQCNRRSRGDELGRKCGAMRYWPFVAESLELLKPLLDRLRGKVVKALDGAQQWTAPKAANRLSFGWFKTPVPTTKSNAKGKNIAFSKDVRARCEVLRSGTSEATEKLVYKETVVPLTSDRKRSAGKFKTRRALPGAVKVEEDKEEPEEPEEPGECDECDECDGCDECDESPREVYMVERPPEPL